jgi:hypothetical protein
VGQNFFVPHVIPLGENILWASVTKNFCTLHVTIWNAIIFIFMIKKYFGTWDHTILGKRIATNLLVWDYF